MSTALAAKREMNDRMIGSSERQIGFRGHTAPDHLVVVDILKVRGAAALTNASPGGLAAALIAVDPVQPLQAVAHRLLQIVIGLDR